MSAIPQATRPICISSGTNSGKIMDPASSVFTQNLQPAKLIGLVSMLALIAVILNEIVRRAELHYGRWRA